MITKTFEVRDEGTFMPVLAIKLNPETDQDRYLLARSGYGNLPSQQSEYIIVVRIAAGVIRGSSDPYEQGSRTMIYAHDYIRKNFDELRSGEVVDVEFIQGITTTRKSSEAETPYEWI